MSTNDERAMILKMLQEGKISVEEADSLLDVLSETDVESPGFAAAASAAGARADSKEKPAAGGSTGAREESDRPSGTNGADGPRAPRVDIDLDFSDLSEGIRAAVATVKESMSGVSDSLRKAFSGMGDISFEFHDGRMGKARSEDERELVLDASAVSALSVSCPRGDVRVIGGNQAEIRARATVTAWGADESAAHEALTHVAVTLEERDGAAVLEADTTSPSVRARVDLEVSVPRELELSLSAVSGDLWIEDVVAACSVRSASGDISIANVGGAERCTQRFATQSGDITASSVSGTIEMSSASGDITVDEYHGELSAVSKSGDVRVTRGDGPAQVQSVSGDVWLEMVQLDRGEPSVTTVGGEVNVVIPREASVALTAKTLSGEVLLPEALENRSKRNGAVTGELNGGGLPLAISTVSGEIHVEIGE